MRGLFAAALALVASPALAHHEVVVAASILPLLGGLAAISLGGIAAWRKRRQRKTGE